MINGVCQKCHSNIAPLFRYRRRINGKWHWSLAKYCILCRREDDRDRGTKYYYKHRKRNILRVSLWNKTHRAYINLWRRKRRSQIRRSKDDYSFLQ